MANVSVKLKGGKPVITVKGDKKKLEIKKDDCPNTFICKHSGTIYTSSNNVIYCSCGETHEPVNDNIKLGEE